ncbi:cs and sgs domain containing protein [Nannochloropsis oceanica]
MVPLSSSSSSASASSPPPRPLTATVASTHALSQPIPALHAPLLPSSFSSDEPPLTLYEDGYLKLTPTKLKVKCYFFPFGLAKTIPLKDIKKVSLLPLGSMWQGQYKHWGMAVDFQRWWPSDLRRAGRTHFIEVDCGSWPRVAFTVNDPENVYLLLSQAMAVAKAVVRGDQQQQH